MALVNAQRPKILLPLEGPGLVGSSGMDARVGPASAAKELGVQMKLEAIS